MCFICDGNSYEDLERVIELSILTHGWFVQSVAPGHDAPPGGAHWSYTIGLTEGFSLPELVVTDIDSETGHEFMNFCGGLLTSGMSFDELNEMGIVSRPVHGAHLETELFYGWAEYYRRPGNAAEFVQLVPPALPYCICCFPLIADLSDPHEMFPQREPWSKAA